MWGGSWVLSQEGHPLVYMSMALTSRAQPLTIYRNKILVIVLIVDKWKPHLLGQKFIVKSDHYSLKYLL